MPLFFDLRTVSLVYYVDMCMVCLRREFHTPCSNGVLGNAVKPEAKGDFRVAATFLFYIRRKYYLKKVVYILKSIAIKYFTTWTLLSCCRLTSRASAMLLLSILGF
jgi:hypothetical protein